MWLGAMPLLIGGIFYTRSNDEVLQLLAVFAVPTVSILHAILLWIHDVAMAQLQVFMMDCEGHSNEDVPNPIPGYHSDRSRHGVGAMTHRTWQNTAFIIIGMIFSLIAYSAVWSKLEFIPLHFLLNVMMITPLIIHIRAVYGRKRAIARAADPDRRRIELLEQELRDLKLAQRLSNHSNNLNGQLGSRNPAPEQHSTQPT